MFNNVKSTAVLSYVEMQEFIRAVANYSKPFQDAKGVRSILNRIKKQSTQNFGKFQLSQRDGEIIARLATAMWQKNRIKFLSIHGKQGRILRANLVRLINSAVDAYADASEYSATDGITRQKFIDRFHMSHLSANC